MPDKATAVKLHRMRLNKTRRAQEAQLKEELREVRPAPPRLYQRRPGAHPTALNGPHAHPHTFFTRSCTHPHAPKRKPNHTSASSHIPALAHSRTHSHAHRAHSTHPHRVRSPPQLLGLPEGTFHREILARAVDVLKAERLSTSCPPSPTEEGRYRKRPCKRGDSRACTSSSSSSSSVGLVPIDSPELDPFLSSPEYLIEIRFLECTGRMSQGLCDIVGLTRYVQRD